MLLKPAHFLQDRTLFIQWIQNLSKPRQDFGQARWQGKRYDFTRFLALCLISANFQVFKFLDGRSHKAHLLKRNPRKVTWTVLYRRKHKKGIEEEAAKKRTKRTQKFQRAVVGATLQDIMAKRNQKPEVRQAQREQAIR